MVAAPWDRQGRDTAWHSPEGGVRPRCLSLKDQSQKRVHALGRHVASPGFTAHLWQGSATPSGQMLE